MSPGSVTYWVDQLKAGDPAAAEQLWQRYFLRLVGLARKKLEGAPRRAADEEDVALSALASLCRGAERGQFPQFADRDDLWHLLKVITVRKAINLRKYEGRQKRGGTARVGAAADAEFTLEEVIGPEPTPELVMQVAEECQRLLQALADDELRTIALARMEGETTEEIAVRLGRTPRTVWRKLQLIRKTWEQEIGP